jgi:hypothetical protein
MANKTPAAMGKDLKKIDPLDAVSRSGGGSRWSVWVISRRSRSIS